MGLKVTGGWVAAFRVIDTDKCKNVINLAEYTLYAFLESLEERVCVTGIHNVLLKD